MKKFNQIDLIIVLCVLILELLIFRNQLIGFLSAVFTGTISR